MFPVVTTTWNEKENIEELILKVRQVLKDFQHENNRCRRQLF